MTTEQAMPRWAYGTLAAAAAAIGLAASVITAKFFILGLERLEADNAARDILIATGILMILTELLAFGLSALLPARQLRALRTKLIICGTLLLTFEVATIYITQVALMQNATAAATASETKINGLIASIDSRRAAAKSLRANGTAQSESSNAWTRTLGAKALRDALQAEQQIDPLTAELAQLQSEARPNLTAVIGQDGMLVYSVMRAFLISAMGLVMFGAAGALLRESRPKTAALPAAALPTPAAPAPVPTAARKQNFQLAGFSLAPLVFTPMTAAAIPAPAAPAPAETATTPSTAPVATATAPSATPHPTQTIQLPPAQAKKGRVSKHLRKPCTTPSVVC